MIYLDNAATTYPKPKEVQAQMAAALQKFGANPGRSGYRMGMLTGEAVYGCRSDAAAFFHADGPECIVFQPGCTQAVNAVLKGFLKSGDHVVVSDLEHNAVMRPLQKLTEQGVTYTVVETYPGDDERTVQSFREAIHSKTRLLVCMHASNVFGFRMPVEQLAALAHAHNLKICVDCAQSAGVLPIHMQESGIDYLCVAGHKGLYGPMGTGLLILRQGDVLETLVEGGTGTQSRSLMQPEDPPERYESGTQNIPGILGLQAGIRFVSRVGISEIYRHEMQLVSYLYKKLANIQEVELYTGEPAAPGFVPVLSFNVKGASSEEVGEFLAKEEIAVRCGLHCAPAAHDKVGTQNGTVRVAPSIFTQKKEIDRLVQQIWAFKQRKS